LCVAYNRTVGYRCETHEAVYNCYRLCAKKQFIPWLAAFLTVLQREYAYPWYAIYTHAFNYSGTLQLCDRKWMICFISDTFIRRRTAENIDVCYRTKNSGHE